MTEQVFSWLRSSLIKGRDDESSTDSVTPKWRDELLSVSERVEAAAYGLAEDLHPSAVARLIMLSHELNTIAAELGSDQDTNER